MNRRTIVRIPDDLVKKCEDRAAGVIEHYRENGITRTRCHGRWNL